MKITSTDNLDKYEEDFYEFRNFTLSIQNQIVVKNLNTKIKSGDIFIISGKNGTGKSTLMKSIVENHNNSLIEGKIEKNLSSISYLSQFHSFDKNFPIDVYEVISMGLYHKNLIFKKDSREDILRAAEKVGLGGKIHSKISNLSGGEIQRMRFAQIILQNSSAIFLDEPFVNIDIETIEILLKMIFNWQKIGKIVTIITHDALDQIQKNPHKILDLDKNGQLFEIK
jgi:zinc/manganese transport system ATP-binding protein